MNTYCASKNAERESKLSSGEYRADTISCVIEVGVPLRYIATKICALFWGGINPFLTIACTRKTPMMGNNTIFATQTERIAAIGKREIGRGIFILAKKEPRSTRESGIVMAPTKAAVSMINARGGLPSGPFHEGPPSELTSTNSALRGWIREIHIEPAITRLRGAKTSDKVWRNRWNRGFTEDAGQTWTGNTPGGDEAITWPGVGFSPFSTFSGTSFEKELPTSICGAEITGGRRGGLPSRYL